MTIHRSLLLVLPLLLVGCGASDSTPPPPPPVRDTAFGDLVKAEDKARAVEGTVMEQKKQVDQAVKDAQ